VPLEWRQYITSDPEILHGKPYIKGTRIAVHVIVSYLAAGKTIGEVGAAFPDLTREQIAACRDYARDMADFAATE
jgi:uncharacterized protein (DUF433 family)